MVRLTRRRAGRSEPLRLRAAETWGAILMALSQDLLNILACPKCKGELRIDDAQTGLVCEPCKLRYLIKDDIPIMLVDEAERLP